MGEGARAGIDIHYGLRKFPMSLEELEDAGELTQADAPGVSDRVRERARAHESNVRKEQPEAADD
jgi:thioredoxin reductase (NADPH)